MFLRGNSFKNCALTQQCKPELVASCCITYSRFFFFIFSRFSLKIIPQHSNQVQSMTFLFGQIAFSEALDGLTGRRSIHFLACVVKANLFFIAIDDLVLNFVLALIFEPMN